MSSEVGTVRIYYFPQSFPCGPQSGCCGPVGTSREELDEYVSHVEAAVPGARVEAIDASGILDFSRDTAAIKLLNTFGAPAFPIFAVNGEVVSMGPPTMGELGPLLAQKMGVQT